MTDQNPIPFPPTNKFHQWEDNILNERENVDVVLECVWKDGFQAGADQELEACCQYINEARWFGNPTHRNDPLVELRAARRPKPPSLKEQALEWLIAAEPILKLQGIDSSNTIRRALEALPND